MSNTETISCYVGEDEHGTEWARACVVTESGHEHPTLSVSVRIGGDEDRTRDHAIHVAQQLLLAQLRAFNRALEVQAALVRAEAAETYRRAGGGQC